MSHFQSDLKIIVTGNSQTGKTSFVNKYTKNIFNDSYKPIVVSEFGFKIYQKDNKLYRLHIWNFNGQDENGIVTKTFAKDAHGCIILSDATNIKTRKDTLKWKKSVDEVARFLDGGKLPCILVESKGDILKGYMNKYYFEEKIKNFAKENGFDDGFLGSSKTGKNIIESFDFLIGKIIERMELMQSKGFDVFKTRRESLDSELQIDEFEESEESDEKEEKEEKEIVFGDIKLIDLQDITIYDSAEGEIEIYINIDEENKLKKYSYEQKFKELKKQYKILNNIKNAKIFYDILNGLKKRNKIKINLYLKKVVVQVGIIFNSILGDEEEITFELISEDIKKKDLIEYLTKFLNKIKNKNNLISKTKDSLKNEIKAKNKE